MNSYTLNIDGSTTLLALICLVLFIGTVIIYRRVVPEISFSQKTGLVILRSAALIMIVFFLFEPIWTMISGKKIHPICRTYLDNSISMSLTDAAGNRKTIYNDVVSAINTRKIKNKFIIYKFGESVSEHNLDQKLSLKDASTNLSEPMRKMRRNLYEDNACASLFITDGCFNTGENPIYEAMKFNRPIYIIGIGDTAAPKDASVKGILTNEVVYKESPIPVNANISISGFPADSISAVLYEDGKQISKQKISFTPDNNNYSLVFEYTPKTSGNKKLTVKIPTLKGEITDKNNTKSVFVKVLEDKQKIALFAGAPTPDISFINSVIRRDKGIELKEYIQKSADQFYVIPTKESISSAETIVMIDFPNKYTPDGVLKNIAALLDKGIPILFFAGYNTDYQKLQILIDYLPFNTLRTTRKEYLASPDANSYSLNSPIMRINDDEGDIALWNSLPPVYKTETFVKVKPESDFVLGVKVNKISISEPLIVTRNFEGRKSVAVLAYGLFRWKLMGQGAQEARGIDDSPDIFSIFVSNSMKWLSTDNRTKTFICKTTKQQYSMSEPVVFNAQLYDAAFTPIDKGEVFVRIYNNDFEQNLNLEALGNGRYSGQIEGLKRGDYKFSAIAKNERLLIAKDNGIFSVGDISPEYDDLRMNKSLLTEIAKRSGGKYYDAQSAEKAINDIIENKNFVPYGITLREEMHIWEKWYFLVLAIVFFTTEWFLRKRYGLL
ncbi:MAG: hypothetical protein WCR42_14215 [bacterium]